MEEKLWNRQFVSLFFVNTLNSFGFYMIVSVLSKYLVNLGIALTTAGVIVGMFSITSLFVRPFCGILSDQFNKVRILLFALALESVGMIGYAAAGGAYTMTVFRILNGVGFGIVSTVLIALATYYIPRKNLGEGIGYLGISQVISSAIAPGMGIEIAKITGYRGRFFIAGTFTVIGFLLVFFLRGIYAEGAEGAEGKEKEKGNQRQKKLSVKNMIAVEALGYTGVSAAYSFINGIITSYLLLFAEERGILNIGIYYTVCAVCLFIFKPFSGKLVDKKGIAAALYPAIVLTGVSMFLLGKSVNIEMIVISGILRSIGQGTAMPALQSECIKEVGKERSGVATSTYYLGGDVAQGIGPMIGGAAVGILGYQMLFDLCGVLLMSMLFVFWIIEKRKKGKRTEYEKRVGKSIA
ncbi:MAG: MFS transporter [Coprococcus sp.]|nr:MFS transporter [Coprococcus sp.]